MVQEGVYLMACNKGVLSNKEAVGKILDALNIDKDRPIKSVSFNGAEVLTLDNANEPFEITITEGLRVKDNDQ